MPKYAKYLEDMVTIKTKLGDIKMVALTEVCSSVVLSNMPINFKDLGNFTLPIHIGKSYVVHALSDLGKSINLISLSVFNTLGLRKLRPCSVVLQITNITRVCLKES